MVLWAKLECYYLPYIAWLMLKQFKQCHLIEAAVQDVCLLPILTLCDQLTLMDFG
jgi:hypothetical protein